MFDLQLLEVVWARQGELRPWCDGEPCAAVCGLVYPQPRGNVPAAPPLPRDVAAALACERMLVVGMLLHGFGLSKRGGKYAVFFRGADGSMHAREAYELVVALWWVWAAVLGVDASRWLGPCDVVAVVQAGGAGLYAAHPPAPSRREGEPDGGREEGKVVAEGRA